VTATLYGVGVGPGASDLITLRAIETTRRVPVLLLALPRRSGYGASKAWEIVRPTISEVPGQKHLFLTFPMSKDPERLRPAWELAFRASARNSERPGTWPS
jgi:precorrin-2/cobalt-factor-2 C20-methyltransferase